MRILVVLFVLVLSFFFFKQKTAYEMRISDWSSDVCSSDLSVQRGRRREPGQAGRGALGSFSISASVTTIRTRLDASRPSSAASAGVFRATVSPASPAAPEGVVRGPCFSASLRSEEHTSELQSLMRHSYAVFCLTKNNTY